MGGRVNIRLETDPSCQETEVIIRCAQRTERIENMIRAIENCAEDEKPSVAVYRGNTLSLIDPREIIRVYTENRRLMVCADSGIYECRQPLKNLETVLLAERFVRISRFEIVNLRKIAGFDFSHAGTIRVIFQDGSETWVARRYVRTIQQMLRGGKTGKEA